MITYTYNQNAIKTLRRINILTTNTIFKKKKIIPNYSIKLFDFTINGQLKLLFILFANKKIKDLIQIFEILNKLLNNYTK